MSARDILAALLVVLLSALLERVIDDIDMFQGRRAHMHVEGHERL